MTPPSPNCSSTPTPALVLAGAVAARPRARLAPARRRARPRHRPASSSSLGGRARGRSTRSAPPSPSAPPLVYAVYILAAGPLGRALDPLRLAALVCAGAAVDVRPRRHRARAVSCSSPRRGLGLDRRPGAHRLDRRSPSPPSSAGMQRIGARPRRPSSRRSSRRHRRRWPSSCFGERLRPAPARRAASFVVGAVVVLQAPASIAAPWPCRSSPPRPAAARAVASRACPRATRWAYEPKWDGFRCAGVRRRRRGRSSSRATASR